MTEETTIAAKDDPEHLLAFCGRGINAVIHFRHTVPFVRNGHRYFSDQGAIVRIPATEEPDTPQAERTQPFPPAEKLVWPSRATAVENWPAARYRWTQSRFSCEGCEQVTWHWFPSKLWQEVAGRLIPTQHHAMIAGLPGILFSPAGDSKSSIYFAFDGGEGMVMPCIRERCQRDQIAE